jgi:hypothetical protein
MQSQLLWLASNLTVSIPQVGKDVLQSFSESEGRHVIIQVWVIV